MTETWTSDVSCPSETTFVNEHSDLPQPLGKLFYETPQKYNGEHEGSLFGEALSPLLDNWFADMQVAYLKHLRRQRVLLQKKLADHIEDVTTGPLSSNARGPWSPGAVMKALNASVEAFAHGSQVENGSLAGSVVDVDDIAAVAQSVEFHPSLQPSSACVDPQDVRLHENGLSFVSLPMAMEKLLTGQERLEGMLSTGKVITVASKPAGAATNGSTGQCKLPAKGAKLGGKMRQSLVPTGVDQRKNKVSVAFAAVRPSMGPTEEHLEKVEEIKRRIGQIRDQTDALTQDKLVPKMKKSKTRALADGCFLHLAECIHSPYCDCLCAFMIIFNSVLIGIATEYLTTHDSEAVWMNACFQTCNLFFFLELVARMIYAGREYFWGDDMYWNIFDFILVLFSVMEIVFVLIFDTSTGFASSMKTVKMLRIVRIFRVFRFFGELAQLAGMIINSCKSLVWAVCMLSLIIYVFAICFTSFATTWSSESCINDAEPACKQIHERFGSLGRTTNTLIESMLGGVSWGEVSTPLFDVGWLEVTAFFGFIFFSMLAVLNVITGVFVENAIQSAKSQRDFVVNKELELKEMFLDEMSQLFRAMDEDASGELHLGELECIMKDVRIKTYFEVLGIDAQHIERLFRLLDQDDSGCVDLDEFLSGCLRLKGNARSIDMHSVMRDQKTLMQALHVLFEHFGISSDEDHGLLSKL